MGVVSRLWPIHVSFSQAAVRANEQLDAINPNLEQPPLFAEVLAAVGRVGMAE